MLDTSDPRLIDKILVNYDVNRQKPYLELQNVKLTFPSHSKIHDYY